MLDKPNDPPPCAHDCDSGWVECWSPGGPCSDPGRPGCETCGPCSLCHPTRFERWRNSEYGDGYVALKRVLAAIRGGES